jgi:hypothetical protein
METSHTTRVSKVYAPIVSEKPFDNWEKPLMQTRLPELSRRLAHHFPDALSFIVPFYNELIVAGFEIDERRIKLVLRRNGKRIATDYGDSAVRFRFSGEDESIATVDLAVLRSGIGRVGRVSDYLAVDSHLDTLTAEL